MMKLTYYSHGDRLENKIALTFDDGPNPFSTEKILKILKKYKVKATFFIIGKWAILYPKIVRKIFSEGHLIGNHSYSHQEGDFRKATRIIKKIIGESPNFIRPPYSDLKFCSKSNLKNCSDMKIITFDIGSLDYTGIPPEEIILIIEECAQNGSIIDFHDGSESKKELKSRSLNLVNALPIIIKTLKDRGFELTRVDKLSLVPKKEKV